MKKFFYAFAVGCLSASAMAAVPDEVGQDGLFFRLNETDQTAMLGAPYRMSGNFSEDGYWGDVVIPAEVVYDGVSYAVTSTERDLFYRRQPTSISFPETLLQINEDAFYGVTTLPSLTFPNSLETIASGVFYNCSGLTEVTFGSGLKSIAGGANASKATFYGCTKLNKVVSKATVPPTIGTYTFPANVAANATLFVPEGTREAYIAAGWTGFAAVEEMAPESNAIDVCINGIWYRLDNGEASVIAVPAGEEAYEGVLEIPNMVEYDGETYPVVTLADSCFAYNTEIIEVILPATLQKIENFVFTGTNIKNVYIPDSVTSIGQAFWKANVERVALGTGISEIPTGFIMDTTSLKYLSVPVMDPPTLMASAIPSSYSFSLFILVPQGAYTAYSKADQWKNFFFVQMVNVAETIEIDPKEYSGEEGTTLTLKVNDPAQDSGWNTNAWFKESTVWTSSDSKVATVDEKGVVSLISKGEAFITATYASILTPRMTPLTAEAKVLVGIDLGVDGVEVSNDTNVRYYNLQGIEVNAPVKGQAVIEVRGNKVKKVIR